MNKIIPVIHMKHLGQAVTNVELCNKYGINQFFLIDHTQSRNSLVIMKQAAFSIKEQYGSWIGVNLLGHSSLQAAREAANMEVDALWTDNAHIIDMNEIHIAEDVYKETTKSGIGYFGGVEFKYQRQPKQEDLEWVHKMAVKYTDVITTSGPATGEEISLTKLARMRENVGKNAKIAVASGVNSKNKKLILEHADFLMVASSITQPGTELIIEDKLKELIDA